MAPGSTASGRRPFSVRLAAGVLLALGIPGLVSSLAAGDAYAVLAFTVLMILGMAGQSWAYFLRCRANSAAH